MIRSAAFALLVLTANLGAAAESGGTLTLEQRVETALASPSPALGQRSLQEILATANQDECLRVLSVLEQKRSALARPLVESLMAGSDAIVANRAVAALTLIGPGSVEDHDALDRALLSGDQRVRRGAIAGIVAWGGLRHVPALAAKLQGDDERVMAEAESALASLTGQRFGRDAKAWTDWYTEHDAASRSRFDELVGKLRSDDGRVVASAIADLAVLSDRRAEVVDLVKPLLRDQDDRVAGAAYTALKTLAPAELIGVDEIKAPAAPVRPRPQAAPPVVDTPSISWTAVVIGVLALGGIAWWLRGVASRMNPISVNEAVARAQRDAGYAPAARAAPRPAAPRPVVSGVKPAAPAAPAAKSAKPPAKPVSGGRDQVFKLD